MTTHALDADAVQQNLPRFDVFAAVRSAFAELASGTAVQAQQTVLQLLDGGDVIVYSAALQSRGVMAVKASPYLPGRTPTVTAWTMLVSLKTGEPVLLCDSAALTVERTAATTALAVDALAPSDPSTLAVVGAGPLARAHIRYAALVREFTQIRVFSPRLSSGDADSLTALRAECGDAQIASTAAEAVANAEVVLLCTSATQPVVELDDLDPSALVTSITTNAPSAHEIDPGALMSMAVYCDLRQAAAASAGEMRLAQQTGWTAASIVTDLPELIAGTAPPRPAGRAFFRSVGLGIEDAAAATALLDSLQADLR